MMVPYAVSPGRESTPFLETASTGSLKNFTRFPHHKLVGCTRYICFVPLLSIYALDPDARFVDPNFHVLELIPEHVRRAAAESRCVLVLDAASEGDPFIPAAYEYLHAWLERHGIPQISVVIINQNRVLGRHYRQRTDGMISFLSYDSYIKKLLYAMVLEMPQDIKSAQIDSAESESNFYKYVFLCMNGTVRLNRILIVASLLARDLLKDCYWSMLGETSGKSGGVTKEQSRTFLNSDWSHIVKDEHIVETLASIPRLFPEEEEAVRSVGNSNQLAGNVNPALFHKTFASIVTETEFSNGDVRRITEKSIRAFAMGHPTIIAGNPLSLPLVRELGFQTFYSVFDEHYDERLDPIARLEGLLSTAKELRCIALEADTRRRSLLREICLFNKSLACGGGLKTYEEIVERPLVNQLLLLSDSRSLI